MVSNRTVDAKTQLYGIFGNPVAHSLSPLIHNTEFLRRGLNAVYLAFCIEPASLRFAFESVRSLGIRGVNITVPFKEEAMNLVDETPEDLDRCLGAINTVVNRNGKLFGYNTDGPGFLMALHEELSFNPENKRVLVLGAGGAARSVVFSLARARVETILIYNRTVERAQGLKRNLEDHFPQTEVEVAESLEALKGKTVDLVVNATSCGMTPPPVCRDRKAIGRECGQTSGGVKKSDQPVDLRLLKSPCAVYDLIYSPLETALLRQARGCGFACVNGLGMLANQAARSFELWTGQAQGVRESMRETLKRCCF